MKKWVFALIVGIALLSLGARTDVNANTITCGSQTMGPADVCQQTRGGSTTTWTYEEMKKSQESGARTFNSWGRWALLGAGGVLTIVGIFGIVVVRRRRRATAAAQPQAVPAPFVPSQQMPNTSYPRQAPYPQQMPPQSYPQRQYPPQGFGPTGPRG